VVLAVATHPYAGIIETLPLKSPIWTATLIGAIGDVSRFSNVSQFKAYLGSYPELTRSGSSIDDSQLAKSGVRPARNVLGQMTVITLSSKIKATPYREVYQRLTGRGMRPATALGHVAGKLSVVLYGMLKHRKELALVHSSGQPSSTPIDISLDLVDIADATHNLDDHDPNVSPELPPGL
jgi:hypothetical protein